MLPGIAVGAPVHRSATSWRARHLWFIPEGAPCGVLPVVRIISMAAVQLARDVSWGSRIATV